jgi:hypothetical protein
MATTAVAYGLWLFFALYLPSFSKFIFSLAPPDLTLGSSISLSRVWRLGLYWASPTEALHHYWAKAATSFLACIEINNDESALFMPYMYTMLHNGRGLFRIAVSPFFIFKKRHHSCTWKGTIHSGTSKVECSRERQTCEKKHTTIVVSVGSLRCVCNENWKPSNFFSQVSLSPKHSTFVVRNLF